MGEPVFKFQKTKDTDDVYADMAQGIAETLRDGAKQVARYQNREKLPVAVAAHRFNFDTGSQEPYILVVSGFICRRADVERFVRDELNPCLDRIVADSDTITSGEVTHD